MAIDAGQLSKIRQSVSTYKKYQESKSSGGTSGSRGSSGSSGSRGSSNVFSFDKYQQYENEYANWQKTGKNSADYNKWGNQKDYDIWKQIRSGKYKTAQVGGDIYYMDNDTYKRYDKEYDTWQRTGKNSDDYGSWGTSGGATAFRYIRDEQNGYGGLNNLKASLDDELTKAVAEKYRSQWGDKYYYDMSDPDDIAAMATGGMPAYLRKKYKTSNPIDQYLLEQGLPYASLFNDMYSEAWQDRNERNAKKQSIYEQAFGDVAGFQNGMQGLRRSMYEGSSLTDALGTGEFDYLGDYYDSTFGKVKDDDPEGKKYFAGKQAALDPIYERGYEALLAGEIPDDEFFDQWKDSTWKSYLKQKQKWNEGSFQDIYDYRDAQQALEFLNKDTTHTANFDYRNLPVVSREAMEEAGYKINGDRTAFNPVVFTSKDKKQSIVLNPVLADGSIIPDEELKAYAEDYFGESGWLGGMFNRGGEDPDGLLVATFGSKKEAKAYADQLKTSVDTIYGGAGADFVQQDEFASRGMSPKIDLYNRPQIDADTMRRAGWDAMDGEYATVYSAGYSNSNGTKTFLLTPIAQSGKVYDERFLEQYADKLLSGGEDDIGLVLGMFVGKNSIQEANEFGERLHQAQEQYYGRQQQVQIAQKEADQKRYETIINDAIANGDAETVAELVTGGDVNLAELILEENWDSSQTIKVLDDQIAEIDAKIAAIHPNGRGRFSPGQSNKRKQLEAEKAEKEQAREAIVWASKQPEEFSEEQYQADMAIVAQNEEQMPALLKEWQDAQQAVQDLHDRIEAIDAEIKDLPRTSTGTLRPSARQKKAELEEEKAQLEKLYPELNGNEGRARLAYQKLEKQNGEINSKYAVYNADLFSQETFAELSQRANFEKESSGISDIMLAGDDEAHRDAKRIKSVIQNGTVNNQNEWYSTQYMTDEEIASFNYIVNTQGCEAGVEYIEKIMPALNQRLYTEVDENAKRYADEHGAVSSIATLFGNLTTGAMEGVPTWASSTLYRASGGKLGRDVQKNDPRLLGTRYSEAIRGNVAQNIAGEDPTQWSKILAGGYNFAMSTGDNMMRAAVFGQLPTGIGTAASSTAMYGNVFGGTVLDYMEKGAGADQVYWMGTLAAAAEALGEGITFNEYLNVKNGAQAAAAAKAAGQQFNWGKFLGHELLHTGTSEMWEEEATEVLNFVFDYIVMGDDSKLSKTFNEAASRGGNGDGWMAVFKEVFGDTFKAGVAGFFSGILVGASEMEIGAFEQALKSGAQDHRLRTGHQILLDNVNTQVALENAFRNELDESGTAAAPQIRAETIETIANLGLSDVQSDAIIRVYDMFASSPNSLLSDKANVLLNNFHEKLTDATVKIDDSNKKQDARTKRLMNKQNDLWTAVITYQQDAHQALETGNLNAHNKAREKLTKAIQNYNSFNGEFDLDKQEIDAQHDKEVKAASKEFIEASLALSDQIEAETEYQTQELMYKMSEGKGAEDLSALGEKLRLRERADEISDFAAEYAMQIGDQDAWQFWTDVSQAKARGEDISDLAASHPEYVNSMYEEYVHDHLFDDLVGLNAEYTTAVQNQDANGMQRAEQKLEQLRDDYGNDIVSAAMEELYGGEYGREESYRRTGESGEEELQIPYSESGRNIYGEAERIDTGGIQERGTDNGSGSIGKTEGSQRTVRNSTARWDERARHYFRDAVRQWISKTGLDVQDGDFVEIEELDPGQTEAAGKAMHFIGGESPFFFKSQNPNMFHGVAIGGREYVMDEGDDTIVFTMGHERGHNSKEIQNTARDTFRALGQEGERIFRAWAEKLEEVGDPVQISGPGRQSALNEFYSDMYGAFLYELITGKSVAGSLGLDQSDVRQFYDPFLDQMSVYAEQDTDETPGLVGRLRNLIRGGDNSQRSVYASAGLDVTKDENGSFTVLKDGKPVSSVTTDDIYHSSIGAMIRQAERQGYISARDARIQRGFMCDLVNMMIEKKDADLVWAWAGTQVFSAITNNSDPQYDNTVDFTTICRKTQALIDAMSARMTELQRGLTDQEILDIQKELADRGETVPCPVCYVFSRWVGIGAVLDRINGYQQQYADIDTARESLANHTDPNAETWLQNVRLKPGYKPVPPDILYDLNKGGEFASQYPLTWKYRTTRGPALGKAMTPYAEMNTGDVVQGIRKKDKRKILKGDKSPFAVVGEDGTFGPDALKELLASEKKMKAQNLMGGLRYQSTSDFRTDYALDYLLSFFDVQAVGGKIQTYTKVPEGARLLASVGADVNLSVMPKGKGWVLNADGVPVLDSSSITGMDFKTAVDIKDKFDNVQLIMVGINDDHILLSLQNSDIGFVIPYHASGGKADFVTTMARNLGERVDLSEYTNYEDCQTDYINPNSTTEQIAARDLRMRILMHQAGTLSENDQAILETNPYLQNLYNRFYVEGVDSDCYGVKLPKAQANMLMPYEYWDTSSTIDNADVNGERFKEYCESLGIIPRFSGKTIRNGKIVELDHGNFADKPGYWKTLIDRPMYNRDGSYHIQQTINVSGVTSDMLSENGEVLFAPRSEYYDFVDRSIAGKGHTGDKYNVVRICKVPSDIADEMRQASGGKVNVDSKYFALNSSDLYHAYERHSNEKIEQSRDQIALNIETMPAKVVDTILDPSIIEYVLSPFEDAKYNRHLFAFAREDSEGGTVILLQAVGGRYNPTIVPIEILHFSDRKWNDLINSGKSIAEKVYENDANVTIDPVENQSNIKNRVTVAPHASMLSANTSETELHSPLFDNNVTEENADVNTAKASPRGVRSESTAGKNYRMANARKAQQLFDSGTDLNDYMNQTGFDPEVAAQLRGIMLRNGQRVGGRLSDAEMEEISKDSQNWKKKALLALQSPVRVFKNMGRAWDNRTDEGVMRNFHASKKYSDLYYSYLSSNLQQENLYKADALAKVNAIKASETDSILAQLIGEQQIDQVTAQNTVTNGKEILIPMGDGCMVLDHKGRVRYIVDALEGFLYDDNVLKRLADQKREIEAIRKDNKGNKPDRIKQVLNRGAAPKSLVGAKLEETSTGYRIVSGNDVLYEMKNARSAYSDKAVQLAEELSGIYADMHGLVQRSLIENGYAPIGKIEHYFPHFSQGQEGVGQIIEYLNQEDLPIGIAGMTDTFTPGKPWARNLLARIGDKTDYNAVRGFNNYLNSVSDVIFMTPVIQRLRQLENTLRSGGAEGETNPANTNLVTWLHEYTNGVANKKSALDRGMEAMFGRKVYQIIPKISGLAGSAYVVGNVSSALTNFGASFQASGEMAPKYIFKGLFDTAADNKEFGDDIENVIPFLTNRLTELDQIALNSGEMAKTKGMKLLTWLMGAVDGFSSRMVARAKYYECMDRGMSQEEAIRETNKYCVELFAERSKGSKPTVFNSKTLSPFTQFQLEPWNQLWHWFDIHDRNLMREYERVLKNNNGVMDGIDYGKLENQINRMGVAWKDLGQILGRLISMSIFGLLMRAVRGSDSHWNPLGFIQDAARGYKDEGIEGIWDAAVSQAENNAPGVSALTGSYQVPALSIMKNMIETLSGDWDENGDLLDNLTGVVKNIPEASLYAIPAGSQARKSWKGIQAYKAGGNYSPSGKLRYPIEQNVPNLLKSAVFGQSSTAPQGYRWGKDVLSTKSTEYYEKAVEEGADPQNIYEFLLNDYGSMATQTKATKLAALATSDLDDDELDLMASILDIKWDGNIESAAYDALIAEEEKMEDNDKLKDSTKEKRQEAYDFYLDILG